jgi:hypothetical protein
MLVFFEENLGRKLEVEAERTRDRLGNGLSPFQLEDVCGRPEIGCHSRYLQFYYSLKISF